MSDHKAVIDIRDGWISGGFRLECHARPDARCHAIFTCDCEAYYGYGVSSWDCLPGMPPPDPHGQPWHETYEREKHYGRFDPDVCTLADWADNCDGENLSGVVKFDVTEKWVGEGYEFIADTIEYDLAYSSLGLPVIEGSAGE